MAGLISNIARRNAIALALAASGAGLVGWTQSAAGVTPRNVKDKLIDTFCVTDFMTAAQIADARSGALTLDCAPAIQAALDSFVATFKAVSLPANCKVKIATSLKIRRGRSLVSDGSAEIVADFAAWTGPNIALQFLIDAAPTQAQIMTGFGQKTGGFKVTGKNNATLQSYGAKFYDATGASPAVAVNYSYLQGTIDGLTINQFDTAIDMLECWNTVYTALTIHSCRVGVAVHGKSVNVTFIAPRITNASTAFTNVAGPIQGMNVDSGFHYAGGVEGRPEGIAVIGGLIFGHDNNIVINRVLSMTVGSGAIIDGAGKDSIIIGTPSMVQVKDCYIYTGGVGYSCIAVNASGTATSSQILIEGNQLVGNASAGNANYGVHFANGGIPRFGVKVLNNTGTQLTNMVLAEQCPQYSEIRGNYGENILSHHILILAGGGHSVVDGNHTSSAVFPVLLQPGVEASLKIGHNTSPSFATSFTGYATLAAGALTVALPNSVYSGADNYLRAVTIASPLAVHGKFWWIEEQTNWSSATLHVDTATAAAVRFAYTVTSIPYSASL